MHSTHLTRVFWCMQCRCNKYFCALCFTPLKIINADFSNRVASKARSRSYAPVHIHKDLHHYVPQNQLIDLFFSPKRYGSTRTRSSRDRTLPGEFSPSSMSELAGRCLERNSYPLSRMRVVCFQSLHIRDKSGTGTPFSFFLHFQHTDVEANRSSYNTA